jgi:hypothetical protein
MSQFKKQTFRGQRIVTDGNEYTECVFERCEVVFAGGTLPILKSNNFNSCRWIFDGAASRTIQMLANLYQGGWQQLIEETFDNIRGASAAGDTRGPSASLRPSAARASGSPVMGGVVNIGGKDNNITGNVANFNLGPPPLPQSPAAPRDPWYKRPLGWIALGVALAVIVAGLRFAFVHFFPGHPIP